MSKKSKLSALTLAETPRFPRHCHLVLPDNQVRSRQCRTVRLTPGDAFSSDPSEAAVQTQPAPAQTTRTLPPPAHRGPKVGDSKVTPSARAAHPATGTPKRGGHPFFLHLPGTSRRLGTYKGTRSLQERRDSSTNTHYTGRSHISKAGPLCRYPQCHFRCCVPTSEANANRFCPC